LVYGNGALAAAGVSAFVDLSEAAATWDKEDDMAREPSSAVDRAPAFGKIQGSMGTSAVQPVPFPPPEPTTTPSTLSSQPTSAAQLPLVFGGQQSIPTPAEPHKPAPPAQHPRQPAQPAKSAARRSVRSVINLAIDEMDGRSLHNRTP
jgi:hypothetical protein